MKRAARLPACLAAVATLAFAFAPARAEEEPALRWGFTNRASAYWEYEHFDRTYSPWNTLALEYGHQNDRASLLGRVNLAHRFGQDGAQAEFDAYPKLWPKAYGYFSAGVSGSSIFPKTRLGAEIFQAFPGSWEGSLGWRWADYRAGSHVTLWTGSVAYYWRNWWFAARPYHSGGSAGRASTSGNVSARYYLGDSVQYVGVTAGKGSASNGDVLSTQPGRLDTFTVRGEIRWKWSKIWMLRATAAWSREDVATGGRRTSLLAGAGVERFF